MADTLTSPRLGEDNWLSPRSLSYPISRGTPRDICDMAKRYTFLKKIGNGAYSDAWCVLDKMENKVVCIKKTIGGHHGPNIEAIMLRAMRTKESHPNIINLIDFMSDRDHTYLVMDYINGPNLLNYLKDRFEFQNDLINLIMTTIQNHRINYKKISDQSIRSQFIKLTETEIAKISEENYKRYDLQKLSDLLNNEDYELWKDCFYTKTAQHPINSTDELFRKEIIQKIIHIRITKLVKREGFNCGIIEEGKSDSRFLTQNKTNVINYLYEDLKGIFRRSNEEKTRHIFKKIVSAVNFLHKQKIAHRDLKLDNIVMSEDSEPILIDFGFSSFAKHEFHQRCGSPHYVAPEVIIEGNESYNGLISDIWSLGVILFAMILGYLPFDAQADESDLTESELSNLSADEIDEFLTRKSIELTMQLVRKGEPNYQQGKNDISISARDLIDGMIKSNVQKRYTIDDVKNHPWLQNETKKLGSRIFGKGMKRSNTQETGIKEYKEEIPNVRKNTKLPSPTNKERRNSLVKESEAVNK